METRISYGRSEDAWHGYDEFIKTQIINTNATHVCDIGGGANPLLDADFVNKTNISYSILDISKTELNKSPAGYDKIQADIASPDFSIDKNFDFVFSKMLAEHIPNAKQFHRNIFNMLNINGTAIHFFPTLYALPFVVNFLVPDTISSSLLKFFAPRDEYQHAKFPAYYHWCRGPTPRQIKHFRKLNYDVDEYRGYFGHKGYYNKIKAIKKIHEFTSNHLVKRPHPILTSYAYVVLRRGIA